MPQLSLAQIIVLAAALLAAVLAAWKTPVIVGAKKNVKLVRVMRATVAFMVGGLSVMFIGAILGAIGVPVPL